MANNDSRQSVILSEQFQLARLERPELLRLFFISTIVSLLFVLFHLLGSTVVETQTRSAFNWMVARWHDTHSFGTDYSHGYLIPFVTLGLVWMKRRALMEAPKAVEPLGLVVIVGALFLHWVGARMMETRVSLIALIMLIWGIPFYFAGWKVAKLLIFPCAYLIFCIPLNFLDSLAFPLRMRSVHSSVFILNGLGIPAESQGSNIFIDSDRNGAWDDKLEIGFDVADACSGLRSLLAMTALTAVYAYLTQKTLFKKWLLFLASIPLAVIGNIARVITLALVSEAFGNKVAFDLYHSYSGYVIFAVAILLMIAIGTALQSDWRQVARRWWTAFTRPAEGRTAS